MRINHYHHMVGDDLRTRLGKIEAALGQILAALKSAAVKEEQFMTTVDEALQAISDNVSEMPTINDSLEALFKEIAALVVSLKGAALTADQQTRLDTLNALVTSQKERTKSDILANTPQAPPAV